MMKYNTKLCLILLISIINNYEYVSPIIAYDCQNVNMNISTFSLTEVGNCKVENTDMEVSSETIQLIQINDYELVPVIQCKIHVTRQIYYCGMHSHLAAVRNGLATYLYTIPKSMCESMHKYKSLSNFYGKLIDNLIINGTTHATAQMAGRMTSENSCQGAEYEDHKGRWTNVIVQAALEISLNQQHAPVSVNDNRIILNSGTICSYKDKTCVDAIHGYSFWETVDSSTCSESRYTVLYEGRATKLNPRRATDAAYETPVYSVDHGEKVFAMPINKPTIICGQTAYETDHPKFYILKPSESGLFYFTKKTNNVWNMDPVAYTNAKVVFVERQIRGQISKLYADVIAQKCALEQQVLQNLLTLATTSPSEFAFAKMKAPGYTAVNYGEVVHIIKCTPVEVSIRSTEGCYHELPVTYDNKSLYMTPRNRVLQKYATEVGCDPFLYPAYQLNNRWYKTAKGTHEIPSPQILEPTNKNQWRYASPANLFKGGLYSQDDMIKLQQHLLLPTEKQAVSEIITRGVVGLTTDLQGTNFDKFINEDVIESWASKLWGNFWGGFVNLGVITSGLMGIFIVIKLIRMVIDTIMHGMILHELFGWSFRLVAALFNGLTMYLVHSHQTKCRPQQPEHADDNKLPENIGQNSASVPASTTQGLERSVPMYPGLPEGNNEAIQSTENSGLHWLDKCQQQ